MINSENEIRSFSIEIGRIHASHNPTEMDTTPVRTAGPIFYLVEINSRKKKHTSKSSI